MEQTKGKTGTLEKLAIAVICGVAVWVILGLVLGGCGPAKASWTTVTKRSLPFNVSLKSTSYVVADTSGALHTQSVTTWATSSNCGLRAYDADFFPADSASHFTDPVYIGTTRCLWQVENPSSGSYKLFKISGGLDADSAVAGMQDIVFIGTTMPDSSVATTSIRNAAVDGNKISAGSTITAYKIMSDRLQSATTGGRITLSSAVRGDSVFADKLNPKTEGGRIVVTSGSAVQADSIFGLSGTQVFFPDGKLYVGTSVSPGIFELADGYGDWLTVKNDWDNTTGRSYYPVPIQTFSWPTTTGAMRRLYFPGATPPYMAIAISTDGVGCAAAVTVADSVDVDPVSSINSGTVIAVQLIVQ